MPRERSQTKKDVIALHLPIAIGIRSGVALEAEEEGLSAKDRRELSGGGMATRSNLTGGGGIWLYICQNSSNWTL